MSEENKVQTSNAEVKSAAAEERAERGAKLLAEIIKENKPLTGPQMVLVEMRVGITPNEGWAILNELRKEGLILKFKTKDSRRAPALYALPEHRPLIDIKKWTYEVKGEETK